MLYFAEQKLISLIGAFGVVTPVMSQAISNFDRGRPVFDLGSGNASDIIPGQCQVFLNSSRKLIWFIEQRDVIPKPENETSFNVPLVSLGAKKVYPAQVRGINLAMLGSSDSPTSFTLRWREGLIRHGSYYSSFSDPTTPCLRPGFGQTILDDLKRPLESEIVVTNNLGLTGARANSLNFCGPLGRLMSMAFYVDPEIAAKYDASTSKKKKKSLNSQDYEENPTYPAYTPYVDNSGY